MLLLVVCWPLALIAAPASRPATTPSTHPSAADQKRLAQLTRRSIELLKQNKQDEAEKVLAEALVIDADGPTNLYNMACIQALKGRSGPAMDYLERAAVNGFVDFVHIQNDADLVSLRDLPRYHRLIAAKDKIQRALADRVLAMLKRELGAGYLYEVDEAHRLIYATNTDPRTLEALKKWLTMQAASQWRQLFEHRPDQYICVLLPTAKVFHQLVPIQGAGGIYDRDRRILAVLRLGQTVTHEFTHALHAADLDGTGQEPAVWVAEGLATMFEPARFQGEELVPVDGFRLPVVQAAIRKNQTIPLQRLIAMDQKAFIATPDKAYGQSGSLMLWLYEQKLLRKFYDAYKATYSADPTGRRALEQATGKSLAEVESAWKAWVLQRTPPPVTTGPRGPVIGVRFGEANDGLRVAFVLPNGPGDRAGLKSGDTLVGIDGIDIRDQETLMPILATHKVGDQIALAVRRGEAYLDLSVTLAPRDTPGKPPATVPASRK